MLTKLVISYMQDSCFLTQLHHLRNNARRHPGKSKCSNPFESILRSPSSPFFKNHSVVRPQPVPRGGIVELTAMHYSLQYQHMVEGISEHQRGRCMNRNVVLAGLEGGHVEEIIAFFFCCERLSASMARSLHLSLSQCTTSRLAPWTRGESNRG